MKFDTGTLSMAVCLECGAAPNNDEARRVRDKQQQEAKTSVPGLAKRESGLRNMVFGVLWFIGGSSLTVFTYLVASHGGGRYVLAYGAMIAGLVQFSRGMMQYFGK